MSLVCQLSVVSCCLPESPAGVQSFCKQRPAGRLKRSSENNMCVCKYSREEDPHHDTQICPDKVTNSANEEKHIVLFVFFRLCLKGVCAALQISYINIYFAIDF